LRCPFCDHAETKVIDARNQRDAKWRRRECRECERRFTTYERIEDLLPIVVKRDGRREAFGRLKVKSGIQKACEKRPVSADAIDEAVQRIERWVLYQGEREVSAEAIGDRVRAELRELDAVAWLRFSSVYLNFRTIDQFRAALDEIEAEAAAAEAGRGEGE